MRLDLRGWVGVVGLHPRFLEVLADHCSWVLIEWNSVSANFLNRRDKSQGWTNVVTGSGGERTFAETISRFHLMFGYFNPEAFLGFLGEVVLRRGARTM